MSTVQLNLGRRGATPEAMWDLARLWACRLLLDGRAHRMLKKHGRFVDEDMCVFVGLNPHRVETAATRAPTAPEDPAALRAPHGQLAFPDCRTAG